MPAARYRANKIRRSCVLLVTPLLAWGAVAAETAPLRARLAEVEEIARFAPGRAYPLLPGLEAAVRRAPPRDRGGFLVVSCDIHQRLGRYAQALALCEQALELGRKARDNDLVARAILYKASVVSRLDGVAPAHQLVREAEKQADASQDLDLRVRVLVASGQSFIEEGNFPMALTKLQAAATLAHQNEDLLLTVISLDAMTYLYKRMREPAKAFETLYEAMRAARQLGSPTRLANLKGKEALLAMDAGRFQHALKALLAALEIERGIGAGPMLAITLVNLSDCYLKLRDYRNALFYGQQALHQSREVNDQSAGATALQNIGQAYLGMGRLAEGKQNYELGIAWDEKVGDKPTLQIVWAEYGAALERAGDLAGALRAYRHERTLSNELFETRRQKALTELQAQYEADRRQRRITLLHRDNQLKSTEIDNRRLQQRTWWLLALVFALTSVIAVFLYRKVRQANARLEENNAVLKQQSARDQLTGLYNRRHFQEYMRSHRRVEDNGGDLVGALYLVDVDHFKQINDTYGHGAGDAVLRDISAALREILRETDMIVRWGGEEFLAFLPSVRRDSLDDVARRLLDGIPARSVEHQGMQLAVQVSIGFAPFPLAPGGQSMSWERTLNLVDMTLYLAKGQGRNRACGLHGFARADTMALEEIERDIERAWRAGAIDLSVVQGPWPALRAAS